MFEDLPGVSSNRIIFVVLGAPGASQHGSGKSVGAGAG